MRQPALIRAIGRPLPLLAETGSQEVPASIEPLLDPAVDIGARKRSRHAPLPQEELERLPSATEAAFERWVEDLDDSASPRQSIKPAALPPLPDFLLEPFPEADSPLARERPNRPALRARATSATPEPARPTRPRASNSPSCPRSLKA